MIKAHLTKAASRPQDSQISRGVATIPLSGIDVPFHSTYLRSGVSTYRRLLQARIRAEDVQVEKLVDRFIPNIIGRQFQLSEGFVRDAWEVTGSEALGKVLEERWGKKQNCA